MGLEHTEIWLREEGANGWQFLALYMTVPGDQVKAKIHPRSDHRNENGDLIYREIVVIRENTSITQMIEITNATIQHAMRMDRWIRGVATERDLWLLENSDGQIKGRITDEIKGES